MEFEEWEEVLEVNRQDVLNLELGIESENNEDNDDDKQ